MAGLTKVERRRRASLLASGRKECFACKATKTFGEFGYEKRRSDGLSPYCRKCAAKTTRIWADNNREAYREMVRLANAKWRRQNPEDYIASQRRHYAAHRERRIAETRAWQTANRGWATAIVARRSAAIACAIPAWSDDSAVKGIYKMAAEMRAAGLDVAVDHIVPVVSKIVCGLHTEKNLEIIGRIANITKGNRRWPDMP